MAGSNENRHGLRRPYAYIWGRGLGLATSSRRIFPSSDAWFWPLPSGSPSLPPSPMPTYSMPSGPNASAPPLWFENGWCTNRIVRRLPLRVSSWATWVFPSRSV